MSSTNRGLNSFSVVRCLALSVCLLGLSWQQAAALPDGAVEVPDGWKSDARFQAMNQMYYAPDDDSMIVEISGHEPSDLPATQWLDAYLQDVSRREVHR